MRFLSVFVVIALLSSPAFAGVDLDRICEIESSGNPAALNKKSGAYGAFQITKIALKDFNRENGTNIQYKNLKKECLSAHIATWLFEVRLPQLIRNKGLEPTLSRILIAYNCGISCVGKPLPRETKNYISKYHGRKL